jgi:hypothetical protein
MTINSHQTSYSPGLNEGSISDQRRLFADFFDLILLNQDQILSNGEWYACELEFARASAGNGSLGVTLCYGELRLGQLLKGWHSGLLRTDAGCGHCIYITSFWANITRPPARWRGYCNECRQWCDGEFSEDDVCLRIKGTRALLKDLEPLYLSYSENYCGYAFTWGGNGFQAVTKTRTAQKALYEPVRFDVLIELLRQMQGAEY